MHHYTDCDPPSKYDLIEPRYGWCGRCGQNTEIVEVDIGIGRYEYHGYKGVHIDMQDECAVCGGTELEAERAEESDE